MGGHGGLNILPQKKWNVYGRENRLRVARDEEKAAAAEAEVQERHEIAEREHRHRLLLERARMRYGGTPALDGDVIASLEQHPLAAPGELVEQVADAAALRGVESAAHPAASLAHAAEDGGDQRPPKRRRQRDRKRGKEHGEQGRAPTLAELAQQLDPGRPVQHEPQLLQVTAELPSSDSRLTQPAALQRQVAERPQHINLFAEEQARAANPEQAAETRQERQRRGDPLTQTSDAKFDQQFAFGHGVTGAAAVPWYVRPGSSLPNETAGLKHHAAPLDAWRGSAAGKPQELPAGSGAAAGAAGLPSAPGGEPAPLLLQGVKVIAKGSKEASRDGTASDSDEDRWRKGRSKGRSKGWRREGEKRRQKGREAGGDAGGGKVAAFAALREERLRREEAERRREGEVVRQAAGLQGQAPGGRRYHTGFGFGK